MDLTIKTHRFDDGERTKMLFDNEKLEYLLYPNLYIVDQIRKDSGGLSTMEKVLGGIKFFIYWWLY